MEAIENFETEEWRDIPGFPGYQASSIGRIRSNLLFRGKSWKILSPFQGPDGYLTFAFRKNITSSMIRVHQMVALTFHGYPPPGYQVHHIDEKKTNNRPENLEYKPIKNHLSEHASILTLPEKAEVRYLYMNHEHDLSKLADLFSVNETVVRYAILDLHERYKSTED